MTTPARQVLTLARGMIEMDQATPTSADAGGIDDDREPPVAVDDPDRARRIAVMAAQCGGEVSGNG